MKRVGRFVIDRGFINDHPQAVLEAMANIIIVRAECMYSGDYIEYLGLSDDFEGHEGFLSPRYDFIFEREIKDGEEVVKFKGFKKER